MAFPLEPNFHFDVLITKLSLHIYLKLLINSMQSYENFCFVILIKTAFCGSVCYCVIRVIKIWWINVSLWDSDLYVNINQS